MIRIHIAPSTPARMADLLWQLDCRIGLSPVGKHYIVSRPEGRCSVNAQDRGRRLLLRWFATAHMAAGLAAHHFPQHPVEAAGLYLATWLGLTNSRLSCSEASEIYLQQHKEQHQ
jgi:hypothetical protein